MFNEKILFCVTLMCFALGCRGRQEEERLAQREQALLEREKAFAAKEADYLSLLRLRDSLLSQKDTAIVPLSWPEVVAGTWNSKVICQESNCTDYVIGDQRSDTWEFASDSSGLFTRVMNGKQLVRTFSGSFDSSHIYLQFTTDATAPKKVDRRVILDQWGTDVIKGTQVIRVANGCSAKFSVELLRSAN